MKIVGLTGGIGSGKSTIAKMFQDLGVAVYIADHEAKLLMHSHPEVKKQIIDLLGADAYQDGVLNRPYVAGKVFKDKTLLAGLNAIVHPAVAEHFLTWKSQQSGHYVIKEAAILFENEGYKKCDYTILVTAPQEVRVQRVIQRDATTREEVLARIQNQWDDTQKIPLSDFVIENINLQMTRDQVEKIHLEINC